MERKYKAGDEVVVKSGTRQHGIPRGTIARVLEVYDDTRYPYCLSGWDNSVAEHEIRRKK